MSTEIVRMLGAIVDAEHAMPFEARAANASRALFASVVEDKTRYLAVARPADVEQLQRVIQLTAAHGLGVSTQPNAAGNGAVLAPDGGDAIVLDLQRMNRIVEVSSSGAYALVEPGVSFDQLRNHLEQSRLGLWVDCDRDGRNSIVGSIHARHIGYTPYADHLQMQCGLEAVLANGTVVRTGMGALPKSTTWQLFKYNFGPYLDGALTHTAFATISKAGLWLMPAPPHYQPFMVTLPDETALASAIDALRPLVIGGMLPGAIRISHQSFEQALHGAAQVAGQPAIGTWNLFGALYGTPDIVQLLWDAVSRTLRSVNGARIFLDADRSRDPVWRARYGLMRGEPPRPARESSAVNMRLTCVAPIEGDMAARGWQLLAQARAQRKLTVSCEYILLARTMFLDVRVPETRAHNSATETAAAISGLADQLGAAGFGIADESLELRRVFDRRFASSRLTRFTQRLAPAFGLRLSSA